MSTTAAQPTADPQNDRYKPRLNRLFSDVELVVAVLLGLVSVATAYASFQAALYDSQMAADYSRGQTLATEAESLYLEANQQYIQDVQLWNRMTELNIEATNDPDPQRAAAAATKFDTLLFTSVSETLNAAIVWSNEQNQADLDSFTSPFESEDYQNALYSGWSEKNELADAAIAAGDIANQHSDRLTLNTVLMSVSLFLLGVAAVVRRLRVQVVLIVVATGIFATAIALTATVPFTGL